LDNVWGDHVYIEERTVDVHVKRLREALSHAGVMVETVRGAGYRLTAKPAMPIVSSQPSADRASA
jgi:two-component system phosphate regulon response regulator PhoB